MADDIISKLLQGAIKAVKNGEKDLARRAFLEVIKRDPQNEAGHIGLATVAIDDTERMNALRQALTLNPQSPKALEAVRRLGLTPQSVLGEIPHETTPLATAPQETSTDEPPRPRSLKSLRPTSDQDEPKPEPQEIAPAPSYEQDLPPWEQAEAQVAEEEPLPPANLDELFARLNQVPQGQDGVPFPQPQHLQEAMRTAEAILRPYQESLEQPFVYAWGSKKRNRAAEAELGIFYAQVVAATLLTVLVVGGLVVTLLLNNPEVQRVVFAPTWTPSPTPTITPTNTPGFTPTPSVTPVLTATPSATFPPNFATANPLLQPRLTEVYVPVGIDRGRLIVEAVTELNEGRLDDAYETLLQERQATELRGDFLPYYYLSEIALRQGDLTEALRWVDEGEEKWRASNNSERYVPLITVARARITLPQLATQLGTGAPARTVQTALADLTTALQTAIDNSSPPYVEAAVLLSERYLIEKDTDTALRVLDDFVSRQQDLTLNSVIRAQRARIYADYLGQYADAFREYATILRFDPYNRAALRGQTLLALQLGDTARADLFAEQYLARYAGSSEAFRLRGDAWRGQGKFDLALNQYERALLADGSRQQLVRTELAEVYVSRATLYSQLARYEDALNDLTEALRLSDNAPHVRFLRMQVAYRNGAMVQALNDADVLKDNTQVPQDALKVWRARILLDSNESTSEAFALLNDALNAETLSPALTATAQEYLARAYLARNEYDLALNTITETIRQSETISRRYWRARILEARGRANTNNRDSLALARRDYEQVLLWSGLYQSQWEEDARTRYEALLR